MPKSAAQLFDIRKRVSNPEDADQVTQAVYDRLNCLVRVFGDVPSGTVFQTPFAELAAERLPRIREAARVKLIGSFKEMTAALTTIERQAPEATLADFFVQPRKSFPADVVKALIQVRRQGLRLPIPLGKSGQARRASVIRVLLKDAPNLTLLRVYLESRSRGRDKEADAYHYARRFGLLGWSTNDKCCCRRGGVTICLDYTDKWCSATTTGGCAIASDPCPGGPPGGGYPSC